MSDVEVPVSPRTTAEPMAFSRDELTSGGLCVWVTYVILLLVTLTVTLIVASLISGGDGLSLQSLAYLPLVLITAALVGGGISFVAMLIGLPLAWLIGRALRRESSVVVHLIAYAALGAAVGTAALLLLSTTAWGTFLAPASFLGLVIAMPAVIAVPLGWWRNFKRVHRAENERPDMLRHINPDAAYEDSL